MYSIKLGLIGLGKWGKNWERVIKELGIVVKTCDLKEKADCKDYKEILSDNSIKAVIIATEPETHYGIALNALLHGKDVLVEKPMAVSVVEAEDLIKISGEMKTILMVGHILHYHSEAERIKREIKKLKPMKIICRNAKNEPERKDNPIWALGPHLISFALSVGINDIECDFSFEKEKKNEMEIIGETGNLIVDWNSLKSKEEPLKTELKHFMDCVLNRKKPVTDGYDGLNTVKWLANIHMNTG